MHYSIYVEGLPESGIEFEGEHDEPTRRTRRRAERVAAYWRASREVT
jgi:hypothetical protein